MGRKCAPSSHKAAKHHWKHRKSRQLWQAEQLKIHIAHTRAQSCSRSRDYRWRKKVRTTPSVLKEKYDHKLMYQSVFVLPSELLERVFSSVGWEDWVALSSTCTLFKCVVASMVERVVQSFPAIGTHEKSC